MQAGWIRMLKRMETNIMIGNVQAGWIRMLKRMDTNVMIGNASRLDTNVTKT